MLENETHLVFVLLLGKDLGGVGDGTNFLLDLSVSLFELRSGSAKVFLDFLLNCDKFWVLLLDVQSVLQFVDFWDLSKDLSLLLLERLDHLRIKLTWLVLFEHLINSLLNDGRLVGKVLLEAIHVLLDVLELGHSEGTAHFSLLGIPETLIELHLELANHILISLDKALQLLLLFNNGFILSDVVLVNQGWQLELAEILLLDSLAAAQKHGDCHQLNNGLHFLINYNMPRFFIIVNFIHLFIFSNKRGFGVLGSFNIKEK